MWEFVIVRIIRQYYTISLKQVVSNAKMYENYTENLEKFRAAIDKEDSAELESLMANANKIKEEIG